MAVATQIPFSCARSAGGVAETVGIGTGCFYRNRESPDLEETADAMLGHDIQALEGHTGSRPLHCQRCDLAVVLPSACWRTALQQSREIWQVAVKKPMLSDYQATFLSTLGFFDIVWRYSNYSSIL